MDLQSQAKQDIDPFDLIVHFGSLLKFGPSWLAHEVRSSPATPPIALRTHQVPVGYSNLGFRNQPKDNPPSPPKKGRSALAHPPVPKGLLGLSSSDRAGQAHATHAIHASAPLSVVIVVRDVHWCRLVAMLPLCNNGLPGTKLSNFRLQRVAALDYFGRKWQPEALAMALSIQGTQHGFQQSTTHIGQTGKYPRARLPERFAVCTKQEDTWRS